MLKWLVRLHLASPALWLRQSLFWAGAVLVGLAATLLARGADLAQLGFHALMRLAGAHGLGLWPVFVLTPLGLIASVLLTRRVFPGAQGSGIPQVIAAVRLRDPATMRRVLSLRIAIGKILLTLLGLACGASIGREGPTVQVGAALMFAMGLALRRPRRELQRALVLAGGAAGVAAAFNTPLAGIVFAIEELSRSFEQRTSGTTLTAVIVAGITTLALSGNYTYFGVTSAELALGPAWLGVLLCGVAGGLAGGLFGRLLLTAADGLPGPAGRLVMHHPALFAALCGVALAAIDVASGGLTAGTGYAEARHLVEGGNAMPLLFPLYKLAATVISYISGIPGGIFAPSLAIGAGLGAVLSPLVAHTPSAAVVLLGMVGYFAGAVQAPITAAVIVMEMTDNQAMTVPLLATSLLAYGVSRLICPRPLYSALAERFLGVAKWSGGNAPSSALAER